MKSFRDRMTTGFAALIMLANSVGMSVPFLLTQRAAAATAVVTPAAMQGWQNDDLRNDGQNTITSQRPDNAGGLGSLKQSFSNSSGKAGLRKLGNYGPLSNITDLSFDWYRDSSSTAPAHLTPAFSVIVADTAGNSWLLKWEGVYNGYNVTAPADTWTTEDLLAGNFWRIPQTVNGSWVGFSGCNQTGDPYQCFVFDRKLNDAWLSGFNVAGVDVSIGSGWAGSYTSFVDQITINDTVFDFEPTPYVTTPPPVKPAVAGDVIFDSIPNTLPSNFVSIGYQATQTRSAGDKITFAGTSRDLHSAAVTLSSWACESGAWNNNCVTTPGATFNHDITLTLYEVAGDGTKGSLIGTKTQNFAIPYRPTADPTCGAVTQWRDTTGTCFNGLNHVVVFDASGITVPNNVIYDVAYNTQTYGSPALGVTGPYDSLNLSLSPSAPLVGTDQNAGELFWNSTYGGRTLGLSSYTGYAANGNPAVLFTATGNALPAATITTPAESSIVSTSPNSNRLNVAGTFTDDKAVNYLQLELVRAGNLVTVYTMHYNDAGLNSDGSFSVNIPVASDIEDGEYSLYYTATDFDGGVAPRMERKFTIDNTAPNTPNNLRLQVRSTGSFVGLNGWTNKSDVNALWNGNNTEPVTYEYQYWNDVPTSPYKTASRWTHSTASELYEGAVNQGDGKHYFCVVAIDAAGNRSECSTAFGFNYDSTAPVTDIAVSPVVNGAFTVSGDASDNITLNRVYVQLVHRGTGQRCGGTTINLIPSGSNASWVRTYDITTLMSVSATPTLCPEGNYAAHVSVVDMAGNSSTAGWTADFAVSAPVTPVAPSVLGVSYDELDIDGRTGLASGSTTYIRDFNFTLTASEGTVRYQLKYWNDIEGSPFKAASPWNPTSGTWDGHMTTLGDYIDLFTQGYGVHYFAFSACDEAGNCSEYTTPYVVTYAPDEGEDVNACTTDMVCCDADDRGFSGVALIDELIFNEDCDDEDGNVLGETTNTPSSNQGGNGQVLAASTDGLADTGTQNGGIIVLVATGLMAIALLSLRRKQEN